MNYYINCIKAHDNLSVDIREIIPDMNTRRRMSRVVKMGVTTAMESLMDFDSRLCVDAIITASGLGCITDSEKFMESIIQNQEQMLNPTPFIQSTFNTVGAQVAILSKLYCYNVTYSHRQTSFESALLDAMIRLDLGACAVLVGAFDEAPEVVGHVMRRICGKQWDEGAVFFILTSERLESSICSIESLEFDPKEINQTDILVSQEPHCSYFTGVARALYQVQKEGKEGHVVLINDILGQPKSRIVLRCY